ncbi:hypothetical protein TNCV_4696241 [Trichonephila clavipes]|nr:hypothetical protein TNCV_4696241 [Trichonephila clavipes]
MRASLSELTTVSYGMSGKHAQLPASSSNVYAAPHFHLNHPKFAPSLKTLFLSHKLHLKATVKYPHQKCTKVTTCA